MWMSLPRPTIPRILVSKETPGRTCSILLLLVAVLRLEKHWSTIGDCHAQQALVRCLSFAIVLGFKKRRNLRGKSKKNSDWTRIPIMRFVFFLTLLVLWKKSDLGQAIGYQCSISSDSGQQKQPRGALTNPISHMLLIWTYLVKMGSRVQWSHLCHG